MVGFEHAYLRTKTHTRTHIHTHANIHTCANMWGWRWVVGGGRCAFDHSPLRLVCVLLSGFLLLAISRTSTNERGTQRCFPFACVCVASPPCPPPPHHPHAETGECDVTPAGYAYLTQELASLGCGVVVALEGGYNVPSVTHCFTGYDGVERLLSLPPMCARCYLCEAPCCWKYHAAPRWHCTAAASHVMHHPCSGGAHHCCCWLLKARCGVRVMLDAVVCAPLWGMRSRRIRHSVVGLSGVRL